MGYYELLSAVGPTLTVLVPPLSFFRHNLKESVLIFEIIEKQTGELFFASPCLHKRHFKMAVGSYLSNLPVVVINYVSASSCILFLI